MNTDLRKLQSFERIKRQCLGKEDLSRKGSIDEPIRPLVELINLSSYYYTTSTCSGRISLVEKPCDNPGIKKGGKFLLNNHEEINLERFEEVVDNHVKNGADNTCLWLKFEPFIMHIQCLDLAKAHVLLTIALAAGCRNSGITLGKNDKFMVAIRSTSSMEVPLHSGLDFRLDRKYLAFLRNECNRRLKDNLLKLDKFQHQISSMLSSNQEAKTPENEKEEEQ